MSETLTFIMHTPVVQLNASNMVMALPTGGDVPWVVEIRPAKRSDLQSAKLHAMLGDVSKQLKFNIEGVPQSLKLDEWKNLFVSGHAIATGRPYQLVSGLEGEMLNLRESTAKMSSRRMGSLIEYVYAYGASNGARFYA